MIDDLERLSDAIPALLRVARAAAAEQRTREAYNAALTVGGTGVYAANMKWCKAQAEIDKALKALEEVCND